MSLLKPLFAAGSAMWLLLANTSLEAPRLGFVLLESREVWSVRGIAGTFYLGQFAAGAVDEFAFNGTIGVRTSGAQAEFLGSNGEILRRATLDGTKVRQTGLSTIEDTAYVRTSTELWRVDRERADRFVIPELLDIESTAVTQADKPRIVGLSGAGGYIELALASEGQISVRRLWIESGESLIRETFAGNPENFVFLPNGMSLWTEDGVLVLRRSDASTVCIETGVAFNSLRQVGSNMVQTSAPDGRQFAIQLTGSPLHPEQMSMRLLHMPGEAASR